MATRWGIVAAVGCGLALLGLLIRNGAGNVAPSGAAGLRSGDRPTPDGRARPPWTHEERGSAGGSDASTVTSRRGSEQPPSGSGGLPRRRLPDAIANGGQAADEHDATDEDGATGTLSNAPHATRDVPGTDALSAQRDPGGAGGEEPTPQPPSDVVYDGAGRVFDTDSRVQAADRVPITADAGTVSFWAQPQWDSGNPDHATFVQIGETGLRIVKDGSFLRFEYTDSNGDNALGGVTNIGDWGSGDWRYVAATWQSGTLALYVDGQQVFVSTPDEPPPFQADPRLYVGSTVATNGGPVAPAQLSHLTVANRTLSSDEIRALFEAGADPITRR